MKRILNFERVRGLLGVVYVRAQNLSLSHQNNLVSCFSVLLPPWPQLSTPHRQNLPMISSITPCAATLLDAVNIP